MRRRFKNEIKEGKNCLQTTSRCFLIVSLPCQVQMDIIFWITQIWRGYFGFLFALVTLMVCCFEWRLFIASDSGSHKNPELFLCQSLEKIMTGSDYLLP